MAKEILYSEDVSLSKLTKQWIMSIVLLIDLIAFTLLFHFYQTSAIPNPEFDKDDIIAVSAIAIFFSVLFLLIIFLLGYSITIDNNEILLKKRAGQKAHIYADNIDYYKQISKKEVKKLLYSEQHKHRKKDRMKQFLLGTPNYLLVLKSGEKLLLQVNKKPSFEYAMNKILKKYG